MDTSPYLPGEVRQDEQKFARAVCAKKQVTRTREVINVESQRFLFFTPRDVLDFPRVAVLLRRPLVPFRFEGTVDSVCSA